MEGYILQYFYGLGLPGLLFCSPLTWLSYLLPPTERNHTTGFILPFEAAGCSAAYHSATCWRRTFTEPDYSLITTHCLPAKAHMIQLPACFWPVPAWRPTSVVPQPGSWAGYTSGPVAELLPFLPDLHLAGYSSTCAVLYHSV